MSNQFSVLEFLQRQLAGTLPVGATTTMRYPTAISQTLGFRITDVGLRYAKLEFAASTDLHGNQQGTVHGGMLCELADAAIGTAHSTALSDNETFASIDLKISFFRPVWQALLTAVARPIQHGRTITHYQCEITREDGKLVALAMSAVMTLRGEAASGR